jgi:hypothetical protein
MSYTYQITVEAGDAYIDQRPTAEGYTVYATGTVDTETPGQYVITYTFIKLKPAFDTYTENKLVTVSNSTPVITLLGDANKYINIDSIYADDGATTNLGTLETVFPAGGIDTTRDGSYSIMYIARHKGFTSFATRSVHVVGTSNAVLAPANGLDITDAHLAKPAAGIDITDASVISPPANGLDIQDAGLAPPAQGPYGLTAEEVVDAPAAGLDISSVVEFLEADTLTMLGEWIKPVYSPYGSNTSVTPGGYERSGVTRAGSPKIPKRFSELLYGYPEARYSGGSPSFTTTGQYNNYTWNLDETALQNGIVRYTRKVPQNWPTGQDWSGTLDTITADIQHDQTTGLDYFDGLFARYYLDGFWYDDPTVTGNGSYDDFISRPTTKEEQPGGNWSADLNTHDSSIYSSADYKFAALAAGGTNQVSMTVSYYVSAPSDYAPGYTARSTSALTPVSNGMQLSTMSVGSNTNKWPNVIWEYVDDTVLTQNDRVALGWPFINSSTTHQEATYRYWFVTQWQYDSYNSTTGIVKYMRSAIPNWAQTTDPLYADMKYSSEYGTVVFEGLQIHTLSSWNNSDFKTELHPLGDPSNAYDGYLPSDYNYSSTVMNTYNLPAKAELSHMSYHTDPITYINGAKGLLVTRDTDLVNSQ